jgi:hypothetical protein
MAAREKHEKRRGRRLTAGERARVAQELESRLAIAARKGQVLSEEEVLSILDEVDP